MTEITAAVLAFAVGWYAHWGFREWLEWYFNRKDTL